MANEEESPLLGTRYTVFGQRQKLFIVIAATTASIFSPLAANIYYPALIPIRKELKISEELLNITITSYMIFQGLSPIFVASYSDTIGRRPIYIFCFITYITANIALSYQKTFIGLLLLRCLQSTGSSSTVNLAYAVTADIVTSAERGRYIGFASVGPILAPSLGPIIGGLISHHFGWRYIFISLAGAATVIFVVLLAFLPETCRNIVGNGSIPPVSIWNKSLLACLRRGKAESNITPGDNQDEIATRKEGSKFPNPLRALGLVFEYPTGPVILYNGLSFAAYYAITSSISFSFHNTYAFNDVQAGFAYLPIGLGSMLAALGNGLLVDWNYRRIAAGLGIEVSNGRSIDHEYCKSVGFSIEKARLQVALPMIMLGIKSMLTYAWSMHFHLDLKVPLISLFIFGFAGTAGYSCLNTLIIDLNHRSSATAMAANNLVRCFLGAAATAIIMPIINVLGMGWAFTIIAGVLIALTPLPVSVIFHKSSTEDMAY